eukprot:6608701-Alexandrium_andersonii.AAC.1
MHSNLGIRAARALSRVPDIGNGPEGLHVSLIQLAQAAFRQVGPNSAVVQQPAEAQRAGHGHLILVFDKGRAKHARAKGPEGASHAARACANLSVHAPGSIKHSA